MATNPDELARDELAIQQAANRQAFRGSLEARMSGNPVAALTVYNDWLPVIEHALDMQTPPVDDEDSVVRNLSATRD